jgi:hypothetical protein
MNDERESSWIKHYWRPLMAYQYAFVCFFDFVLGPILTFMYFKASGGTYVQWEPLTLRESGFYHLSQAAILGVAAWTRGQEKIKRMMYGEEEIETTTTSQTPTGK